VRVNALDTVPADLLILPRPPDPQSSPTAHHGTRGGAVEYERRAGGVRGAAGGQSWEGRTHCLLDRRGGVATNIEVGPFSDSVSPSRRPIPSDGFASRSGVSAHTPPTRTSASTCRPIPWTATTTPRPWDIWGGFGSKLCASSHRPCSAVTDFRIHDNKSRLEVWPKTLSCF